MIRIGVSSAITIGSWRINSSSRKYSGTSRSAQRVSNSPSERSETGTPVRAMIFAIRYSGIASTHLPTGT
jgi:hypothetical protein